MGVNSSRLLARNERTSLRVNISLFIVSPGVLVYRSPGVRVCLGDVEECTFVSLDLYTTFTFLHRHLFPSKQVVVCTSSGPLLPSVMVRHSFSRRCP